MQERQRVHRSLSHRCRRRAQTNRSSSDRVGQLVVVVVVAGLVVVVALAAVVAVSVVRVPGQPGRQVRQVRVHIRQHGRRQVAHTQPHVLQRSPHIPHERQAGDLYSGSVVRLRSDHQRAHIRHRGSARLDGERARALAPLAQGARRLRRGHLSDARRTPTQRLVQVLVRRLRCLSQVLQQGAEGGRRQAQARHHLAARSVLCHLPRDASHRHTVRRVRRGEQHDAHGEPSARRPLCQARSQLQRLQSHRVRGRAHHLSGQLVSKRIAIVIAGCVR